MLVGMGVGGVSGGVWGEEGGGGVSGSATWGDEEAKPPKAGNHLCVQLQHSMTTNTA